MEKIYIGKIVNTFGIKGELKIVSKFEMPKRVFQVHNHLIIKDKSYEITGVRFHKNNYLVELNNIKDINDIEYLIGNDVYFAKEDLNLSDEEYLISELVNYKVISNNKEIGIITNYDDNKINPLIKVNNKLVLVVDDNKINLKVAERLLGTYGITTECVESGFICIDNLKNGKKYDLILMDDMMPKLSGVETLHKIKEQIPDFNIPTVALTANALTGMREKYLSDGFDDYLAKPISKDELNRVINEYLNKE